MTAELPPTLVLPTETTSVVEAAELYVAAGLPPVPVYGLRADGLCTCSNPSCPKPGKHPVGAGWQHHASLDLDEVRDRFRLHRGNIGIYLKLASLVLIDADGDAGLQTAAEWELPPTLTAQTGSGNGSHAVYRLAPHHAADAITDRRVAPGLDVKVRGQFVAAPSRHASGGVYRWTSAVAVATLPDWLYDRIRKAPAGPRLVPPAPSSSRLPPDVGDDLERRARAYVAAIPPAVSGSDGHRQCFAAARGLMGWVAKGLAESAALRLFDEYNARCQPPWSEKELTHKWEQAKKAQVVPAIADRPRPARPTFRALPGGGGGGSGGSVAGDAQGVESASTPPPGDPPQDDSWLLELLYDHSKRGKAKLVSHVDNVIRVLQLAPEWQGRVVFDDFRARIVLRDAPWDDYQRPTTAKDYWTDDDATRLQAWLRRRFHEYQFAPTINDCERGVAIVAKTHAYNPIRDYLEGIVWDGTPRLSSWLVNYLGAAPGEYTRLVGAWWLISAVARVMAPGCKVDTVPILEGAQGLRKSTALKVLAGAEFFNDTPIDLASKDAYTAIQGCWFVELAELDSLMRVEATRAKAFFSSSKDRFRRAYARHESEELRQCIFVGTTNLPEYLGDPTGARRFWPIACSRIDLAALERDRDQLWAEAVAEYLDGRVWYPETPAEAELLGEPQAERTQGDAWETRIADWTRNNNVSSVTVARLLKEALGLEPRDWTRANQSRAGVIMSTRLKWAKRRPRVANGSREWVYEAPTLFSGVPAESGLFATVPPDSDLADGVGIDRELDQ